ncbi:putative patatin/cPLA2 family phospholipase [Mesonia hippocampi]|uniref:Putative patatin/cPLA2 family phospholipase n=1 Tax=Mesonia hippocampi TaxID=1628250 RepID=A0A840EMR4_9FLAO|nr:patatin-like phospholipase family protein [Mesonia hippocampi]MBB4119679.1 putative patatin/cPLA2 family phospholipase [Mesonia hippocampi]
MKALVISGGGSKGAYAGGVAQFLIGKQKKNYDIFVGTSTGSLLLPHLALGKLDKLHEIYTNVNQRKIFSLSPFVVKKKGNREYVAINFKNTILQFIKKKRTFGESKNLRKLIRNSFTPEEFESIKATRKDVIVTVANLSKSSVEYKSIQDFSYEEFCDWIWISCNYLPFMSLVTKNGYEYADGGFGSVVPIREAIKRGATEVDVIILESENMERNKVLGKNPFSLMLSLFGYMVDQVERSNIIEGKLAAINKNVVLNLYYTPSKLTENSLIFNKKLMSLWWEQGYAYAEEKYLTLQKNKLK